MSIPFKEGDQMKCIWPYDWRMTKDKIYIATRDEEDGIFPNQPYISFRDDNDAPTNSHASRFILHQTAEGAQA